MAVLVYADLRLLLLFDLSSSLVVTVRFYLKTSKVHGWTGFSIRAVKIGVVAFFKRL